MRNAVEGCLPIMTIIFTIAYNRQKTDINILTNIYMIILLQSGGHWDVTCTRLNVLEILLFIGHRAQCSLLIRTYMIP